MGYRKIILDILTYNMETAVLSTFRAIMSSSFEQIKLDELLFSTPFISAIPYVTQTVRLFK